MFDSIKMMLVKKYILGYLVTGWGKLKGYKTQVCIAVGIAVYVGYVLGYIDYDTMIKAETGLGTAGGYSLLDKLERFDKYVKAGKEFLDKASATPVEPPKP